MINIRELRNKNWIADRGGKLWQIDHWESNDKVSAQPPIYKINDVSYSFHPFTEEVEYLKPIPFTTEWAQKFGLIGRIINGLCISESEHQGHEYDLCLYDEHTWDSERRVICPIYYVHQCQNIFLDLAGHIIE